MGLMNQAYDTYCELEKMGKVGLYEQGKEPLTPVYHQTKKAEIEITLDITGNFCSANRRGKEDEKIIIPMTRESAIRTGNNSRAHPLCDAICFFSPKYPEKYEAYVTQLEEWANSKYGHPKLNAILRYVQKGTILDDLQKWGIIVLDQGLPKKPKEFVCWRVEDGNSKGEARCWNDQTLFQAFINYYESTLSAEKKEFCMVTGEYAVWSEKHPKNIVSDYANAKLISSKGEEKFTYRGRFTEARQAVTVSYLASQKVHNVLRWLAANNGASSYGKRTFICWNPKGRDLPQSNAPFLRKTEGKKKPSDYKKALQDTLKGWKSSLSNNKEFAVIVAFDAATEGRLAVTYFRELQASDYLERLYDWDNSCCWEHKDFGVESPSLFQIVNFAFGTLQQKKENEKKKEKKKEKEKWVIKTGDHLMRQQFQNLLMCRIDKMRFPRGIKCALVNKASNLQSYKISDDEQRKIRENLLHTTCAVIRKYHYDTKGEKWDMALEPDKKDISYQYGRLLAVLEKIENDTYDDDEKKRETNAIRMQSVYANRPQYASRIVWEQLKTAYYPQLYPASRKFYDRLIGEIVENISHFTDNEQKHSLGDTYLLGYYLQRNDLYKKSSKKTEESENEYTEK